ncbi:MAG: MotA/TolQ/ExbB proton channel family protein [Bacteroidetes bacterium]|nr:MAG: MotA/TolQ/ExbB proton channel family protein [Bacteroidota bacterium]
MSKKNKQGGAGLGDALRSIFTTGAIIVAFVIAVLIYLFVMGNPINFEGGNPAGAPLPGNYLGMVYKGGWVVPVLITINLVLLIFSVERWITLSRAKGKGRINIFVKNLQNYLDSNQIDDAVDACDNQRGSLANVMRAGLLRYKALKEDQTLEKDQKLVALQKEFEEATALELPILSRNLVILSTIATISVLTGLFGTVLGMIRAFAALATAGAPDALALATGISEALINTAFGILGSLLAVVFYNYFSTRIDNFTYKIDEAGFSLIQTFAASTK